MVSQRADQIANGALGPGSKNKKVCQILDAARTVFLDQGYANASMDAISRASGVSKATLYAHFASKNALFEALISAECLQMSNRIVARALDHGDIRDVLCSIGENFVDLLCTEDACAMYRVVVADAPRFPEIGRIFYASGPKMMHDRIADLLQRANESGQLTVPDAHMAAIQFLSLVAGEFNLTLLLGLPRKSRSAISQYIKCGLELFLKGYNYARDGGSPVSLSGNVVIGAPPRSTKRAKL
jgi:TetR/AcrR family transcriptional repressor of mexJK operon